MSATVRVFVVDDHDGWRAMLTSSLRDRPDLEIIGEAEDGVSAVVRAKELQPDLVLLDIGLPSLNGIEAARSIRQLCPNSKILFLTAERSPQIKQTALQAGGHGYLTKAECTQETLLEAIDGVMRGEYIGNGQS